MSRLAVPRHRCSVFAVTSLLFAGALQGALDAQNAPAVTVEIGQPAVWSLAQAHYLLANMHQENRGLKVPMPSSELNPNSANGARLDFLRSAFAAEVQYSGPAGMQNRLSQERYDADFTRKSTLRADVDARREQLATVTRDLVDLKLQLAQLNGELAALGTASAARDLERAGQVAQLTGRIEARTVQKDLLTTEINALAADEKALALTTPALTAPTPTAAPLPDSLTPLLSKTLDKVGNPSFSASLVLDSFVQMQYELIAKQLTLLRDEVGPDERVIFLELPSSIYTVPGKADDYLVQMKWAVTEVFEADLTGCSPAQQGAAASAGRGGSTDPAPKQSLAEYSRPVLNAATLEKPSAFESMLRRFCGSAVATRVTEARASGQTGWVATPDGSRVRTLDIIPRQSALNVNDHHATQKSFNLAGLFQFISGVGAKVGYERQRTLYEQFMHQDTFASGFGKGQSKFGWTFGPIPGTKRLAPGVRNTYAVLVVPKNAVGLRLKATAIPYKRTAAVPDLKKAKFPPAEAHFTLLVPRELTGGFWVDRIAYTPTPRGQRVVAVLEGFQISPQVGILVNGVPLRRAVSIGRHESALTSNVAGALGIDGEYEYLGSDTLIMSFSMGDAYVGTPSIVLVTPEKTAAINALPLFINYETTTDQLYRRSLTEPMFIEPFELKKAVRLSDTTVQVLGTGFRNDATFFIDGVEVPANGVRQITTQEYVLTSPNVLPTSRFSVHIRQLTRQGFDARDVTFQAPPAPGALYSILEFRPAALPFRYRLTLEAVVPGAGPLTVEPRGDYTVDESTALGGNRFRLTLRAKPEDFLLGMSRDGAPHVLRVSIPVAPSIRQVDNMQTGKPSGPAGVDTLVRLRGVHLTELFASCLDRARLRSSA